jgi:hypothetical protein
MNWRRGMVDSQRSGEFDEGRDHASGSVVSFKRF